MRYTKEQKQRASETLNKYAPRGATVYYTVESVARSGMSRRMRFFTFGDGTPAYLTYSIAVILGLPYRDSDGTVRVDGCGMDMGFAAVYGAARYLHGDGYALNARQL